MMNYNNGIDGKAPEWGDELKASFEKFVQERRRLRVRSRRRQRLPALEGVQRHDWRRRLGSRDEKSGPLWYYKDGKLVSDETPGRAGAHGARMPFLVTVREGTIPSQGAAEDLDAPRRRALRHASRARAQHDRLATAYCGSENRGTGRDEPMLMVLSHGRGRIAHLPMGHDPQP